MYERRKMRLQLVFPLERQTAVADWPYNTYYNIR